MDLKDAYFSVTITMHHRMYLKFVWKGTTCLLFGLCIFIKPVIAHLRFLGLETVDEILVMAEDGELLQQQVQQTITLLEKLGCKYI